MIGRDLELSGFKRAYRAAAVAVGLWLMVEIGYAAEFSTQQLEFFESRIRPVLVERCYECHQGHGAKSGLKLDSRAGVLRGTDYRKVVEPGSPGKSALLFAVRHAGKMGAEKVEEMPRRGKPLSAATVADLEQWVRMGLPWPEEKMPQADPRQHWSFQALIRMDPPLVRNQERVANGIDSFVLAQLESEGMVLAEPADRRTLIRRLYFDLTGLPPTFEEVNDFVSDPSPQAYGELVDRLLRSPRYGERWGRHWLDVARYSDTKGYEIGGRERRFVYSHTYRDWVIRALNEDRPYDDFLLQQLAADSLAKDRKAKGDLAAMGFLTLGRRSTPDEEIDDLLDVTFRGTMALTVSCARCHDHKFDPIPTEDYYSLASVFANSEEPLEAPVIGVAENSEAYRAYQVKLAEKQKVVDGFLDPKLAELAKKYPALAGQRVQLIGKLERVDQRQLQNLKRVVDKFVADSGMEPDKALILRDKENLVPGRILVRGSRSRPGKQVKRHFLQLVAGENPPEFKNGSGRLEMVQAIVDASNPLTARTMVNRVWQHHFGRGLVSTPSDFGLQGEKPTHPQLLDWLAVWFMEKGWSLKQLHRLIVTSSVYQQGSVNGLGAQYEAKDPENRLLWRMNRQRLEFEPMRDAALAVAGRLDGSMFGRSVNMTAQPFVRRRAVYAYIDRQNLDPVFGTFDFSSPQQHSGQRPYTTIPIQSLFFLNSPFVMEQAAHLAKEAGSYSADKSPGDAVKALYRQAFQREPLAEELAEGIGFLAGQQVLAEARSNHQTLGNWQYGWGYYDGEAKRTHFNPFGHWDGKTEQWRPTTGLPDGEQGFGYLHLHRNGGHPANDPKRSAAARWTALAGMRVALNGGVKYPSVKGDGVRLRVVHSRMGLVHELEIGVAEEKALALKDLEMEKGDTLDFVVDCRSGSDYDSFAWKLDLRREGGGDGQWDYTGGYGGPGRIATPLENLAQALLGANEFMFVD